MDIGIPELLNIIALKEVDLYALRKELAERAQAYGELETRLVALETAWKEREATMEPNGIEPLSFDPGHGWGEPSGPLETMAGNWRAQA